MFCIKCGNELPDNAVFCSNCGTPVKKENNGNSEVDNVIQSQYDTSTSAVPTIVKSKRNGVIIGVSIAVLIIIFLIIVLSIVLNNNRNELRGVYGYKWDVDSEKYTYELEFSSGGVCILRNNGRIHSGEYTYNNGRYIIDVNGGDTTTLICEKADEGVYISGYINGIEFEDVNFYDESMIEEIEVFDKAYRTDLEAMIMIVSMSDKGVKSYIYTPEPTTEDFVSSLNSFSSDYTYYYGGEWTKKEIDEINTELDKLGKFKHLKQLSITLSRADEKIKLDFIKELLKLEGLSITSSTGSFELDNCDFLSNLVDLKELMIYNVNEQSKRMDISVVSKLENLEQLFLIGCNIDDISPLENLSVLTLLSLNNNNISDFSPVKGMKKLELLTVTDNPGESTINYKDYPAAFTENVLSARVTSANATASSIRNCIDSALWDLNYDGNGMMSKYGRMFDFYVENGLWKVYDDVDGGAFYSETLTHRGYGEGKSSNSKSEATSIEDYISISLAQLFPEIKDARISAYLYDGSCVMLWYTTDDIDESEDAPQMSFYNNNTDNFYYEWNSYFSWGGGMQGVTADRKIIGTSPVNYGYNY